MRWAGPSWPQGSLHGTSADTVDGRMGQEETQAVTLKAFGRVSHAGACLTVEKESWGDPAVPAAPQLRQQELAASPGQALTPSWSRLSAP